MNVSTKIYDYLIIDGNNLFWRAISSFGKTAVFEKVKFSDQIYRKGLRRAINMVKRREEVFLVEGGEIYFLFDNPFSKINIRKWLTDGKYKHPRKQVPKEFYDLLNQFIDILYNYSDSYRVLFAKEKEADDLVAPLLEHLPSDKKKLLGSNDLDWSRSLSEEIHWLFNETIYTPESFKKNYGFKSTGKRVQLFKTIHGDASDVIPNALPHLPYSLLVYLVKKYKDLEDLLAKYSTDKNIPDNWKIKIREQREVLRSNWKLVDFLPWDGNIGNSVVFCKRNKLQMRAKFEALRFDLEPWMIDRIDGKNFFFQKNSIIVK